MSLTDTLERIMSEAVVADMTAPGSPMRLLTPTEELTDAWVSEYEAAGCNWVSFSVAADHVAESIEKCIETIAAARHWFSGQPDRFVLVDRADDIRRAKAESKLAVSLHFQGTLPFHRNLQLIGMYRQLGVVHALMAYNTKNLVGDGCHERTDSGLSLHGLEVIAEMNRVGMMVDVTHTGYTTAMETIEASQAPVIMSHCSPSAVFDHPRNVPDDLISAMAKKGGVIGIHGVGVFMDTDGLDVSATKVCEFVEHAAALVGPQHVGFGLDFTINPAMLKGKIKEWGSIFGGNASYQGDLHFAPPTVIQEVAELLLQRNYSEVDVRGIVGNNWLRVFEEVCG